MYPSQQGLIVKRLILSLTFPTCALLLLFRFPPSCFSHPCPAPFPSPSLHPLLFHFFLPALANSCPPVGPHSCCSPFLALHYFLHLSPHFFHLFIFLLLLIALPSLSHGIIQRYFEKRDAISSIILIYLASFICPVLVGSCYQLS